MFFLGGWRFRLCLKKNIEGIEKEILGSFKRKFLVLHEYHDAFLLTLLCRKNVVGSIYSIYHVNKKEYGTQVVPEVFSL